jgi:SPP1 gp7 family putative phage head morphogenesis protein
MAYAIAKTIYYPKTLAFQYEKYIIRTLRATLGILSKRLKVFFATNKNDSIRSDDYIDDLQQLLNDISAFIAVNDNKLIRDLLFIGRALLNYTKKQLLNSFKGILSVKVASPSLALNIFQNPLLDKDIDLMLKSWVSTNVTLIKSIQTDLLGQVKVIIEDGYRSALSIPTITQQLQSKFNISKNRARLIARDQMGKLHSAYIHHEHEQLGITEYVWLTTHDERVRKSHKVLDGKVCQWNNPLTYKNSEDGKLLSKSSIGGVPLQVGQDFQCRCSLAAIVNL